MDWGARHNVVEARQGQATVKIIRWSPLVDTVEAGKGGGDGKRRKEGQCKQRGENVMYLVFRRLRCGAQVFRSLQDSSTPQRHHPPDLLPSSLARGANASGSAQRS